MNSCYDIIDKGDFDKNLLVLYDKIHSLIEKHNYSYDDFVSELKTWIGNKSPNTDIEKLIKIIIEVNSL